MRGVEARRPSLIQCPTRWNIVGNPQASWDILGTCCRRDLEWDHGHGGLAEGLKWTELWALSCVGFCAFTLALLCLNSVWVLFWSCDLIFFISSGTVGLDLCRGFVEVKALHLRLMVLVEECAFTIRSFLSAFTLVRKCTESSDHLHPCLGGRCRRWQIKILNSDLREHIWKGTTILA